MLQFILPRSACGQGFAISRPGICSSASTHPSNDFDQNCCRFQAVILLGQLRLQQGFTSVSNGSTFPLSKLGPAQYHCPACHHGACKQADTTAGHQTQLPPARRLRLQVMCWPSLRSAGVGHTRRAVKAGDTSSAECSRGAAHTVSCTVENLPPELAEALSELLPNLCATDPRCYWLHTTSSSAHQSAGIISR